MESSLSLKPFELSSFIHEDFPEMTALLATATEPKTEHAQKAIWISVGYFWVI
jgi:hypothetical protein